MGGGVRGGTGAKERGGRRSRDRQCIDPQHGILKQCTSTRVPHSALAQGYPTVH